MRPALAVAVALAACVAAPAPTASPSAAPTRAPATASPTATPTPSPVPTLAPASTALTSAHDSITVDQPRGFSRVTSPVAVRGTASVFEAALLWRVEDAGGRELAKGNTQASAGAPARGSFSFNANFAVSTDTYGYVVVLNLSARDGRVEDLVRVPVILASR